MENLDNGKFQRVGVEYEFECEIERYVFESESYKIVGAIPVKSETTMKKNIYGGITLVGDFPKLDVFENYKIKAELKKDSKYGYQYFVKQVMREVPTSEKHIRDFLSTILTQSQVDTIMENQPNIIDLIIKNKIDEIQLNKLHNIGESRIEVIVNKIRENFVFSEIINEFSEYDLGISTIKALYHKFSGNVEKLKKYINENPYEILTSMKGIGFKRADKIILKGKPELKNSYIRAKSAINYIIEDNQNSGHTIVSLKQMDKSFKEIAKESIEHYEDAVQDEKFKIVGNYITTLKLFEIEQRIAKTLVKMSKFKGENWECDLQEITKGEEFELTEEQKMTIFNVMSSKMINILSGGGGVGKSKTMSILVKALENINKTYVLLAPTGKASKTLSDYCERSAFTIHRGLGFKGNKWEFNEDNKINVDILIIDEFSMIDVYIMDVILKAIDTTRTKLLFVGDPSQIPSISVGNVSYDMMQSKLIPLNQLTKIFRYAEGGLMKVATNVRNGQSYFNSINQKITPFGTEKDYVIIKSTQEQSIKSTLDIVQSLLNKGASIEDIVVTMAMNKGQYGSIEVNKSIQKLLTQKGLVDSTKFIKYGDSQFHVGDRVLQIKNDYEVEKYEKQNDFMDDWLEVGSSMTSVFNGNIGTIKGIEGEGNKKKLIIDFDGVECLYGLNKLSNLQLGYAVNIFKMQGSQSPYVIVSTPKSHTYMMNRNLLYTAISRTQKQCFHITEENIIYSSLKKSAIFERNTLLKQFMLEYNKKLTESIDN